MKTLLINWFYKRFKKQTGETPYFAMQLLDNDIPYSFYISKGMAYYRFKHRLRMLLLYQYAEQNNLLVVGCANKSEYLTGFFVKYGIDHCADVLPLLNLYKTQLKKFAEFLNIPEYIRRKAPSPDIIPGLTDEFALDISYEDLDQILFSLEHNLQVHEQLKDKADYIKNIKERTKHMRHIFVPKVEIL